MVIVVLYSYLVILLTAQDLLSILLTMLHFTVFLKYF